MYYESVSDLIKLGHEFNNQTVSRIDMLMTKWL